MAFWRDLWFGASEQSGTADFSSLLEIVLQDARLNAGVNALNLSIASVFRARQLNADTVGSVPVRVRESLAPSPNQNQSSQEFLVELVLAMEDNGEAFVSVDPSGNMTVLANDAVHVSWSVDRTRRIYTRAASKYRFRTEGLVRNLYVVAMNRGAGDLHGLGPMQSPRLEGILAAQTYSSEYFKHHGKPSGVLKVPTNPTSEEAKLLKAQWDSAREVRSTAIISSQMEYNATSFSPNDSEWVQTHLVNIGDVSNLFGVPASLLNYSPQGSALTYSNVGDIYQGFWRSTLFPTYVKRITEMWSHVLGATVTFDPEHLFLASLRDRATAAWQLTSMGYEPADVLDTVGLPPTGHTGEIPTTLQDTSGGSSNGNR